MEATAARGMASAPTGVSAAAPAARARKRVPRRRQCQYSRESD
jgi:hypothetical protein